MNMYRLAANGVIVGTAGLSLVACSVGLTTASPAAASPATTAAVAGSVAGSVAEYAGPTGASVSAHELNFQMIATSATTTSIPVIAWGLVTAAGTDHENHDGGNGTVHTLVFPGGTFQLKYSAPFGYSGEGNPSCLITGGGGSTYTLTGGTGKYKGISGSGHFTMNFVEIQGKDNANCSGRTVAFQEVITASGSARLP